MELRDGSPQTEFTGTFDLAGHDAKLTIDPADFVISPTKYPTMITVSALEDSDASDEGFQIRARLDGDMRIYAPTVVVLDDENSHVIPSTWTVAMAPMSTATFTVQLTQPPPISPFTVHVTDEDSFVAWGQPGSLVFNTSDYAVPQTVTVTSSSTLQDVSGTSILLLSDLPTATVSVVPIGS